MVVVVVGGAVAGGVVVGVIVGGGGGGGGGWWRRTNERARSGHRRPKADGMVPAPKATENFIACDILSHVIFCHIDIII